MAEYQYGDDVVGFFTAQSTYATPVIHAGAAAFKAKSITINPTRERYAPQDQSGTRSASAGVQGRASCDFSINALVRPSGALGTAPDIGLLLTHGFGTETVNASTDVQYTLLKDATALFGTLHKKGTTIHEHCYGAVITQIQFSWGNNAPMEVTFTGKARDGGMTVPTLADGAGTAVTDLVLDDADAVAVGSILSVAGATPAATDLIVTAVDHTTETATIASSTWADDAVVTPYLPTATLAGTPLYGIDGSLSFDGGATSVLHRSGSITIDTGFDLVEDEYGEEYASEVIMRGKRNVTFSLDFLLKESNAIFASQVRRKIQKDVHIILGDTAADKWTFDMPICELTGGNPDSPETGPLGFQLQGTAIGSSGEDELTLICA